MAKTILLIFKTLYMTKMKNPLWCVLMILLFCGSCTSIRQSASKDDGKITVNFVQVNDVYEIAPLNGGKEGGMARVATVKKKYLNQNPNTFLIMAGDFLSPSVYNSLKYENQAVKGRQMIAAMNAAGMDYAIFGNHEFDLKDAELQERINESDFQWISSNTFHQKNGKIDSFSQSISGKVANPFPETYIKTVRDADGTMARIGFIAVTLPFNKAAFVHYEDALLTSKKLYAQLKDSVDAVIAITHQSMQEDEMLAKEIPGLTVIMGGHEHDQRFEKVGNIYITKAMANAKSAYIITLTINKKTHQVKVEPKLELLNDRVALDPATNVVVNKWVKIANDSYASLGFDADKEVLNNVAPLDGRETEVRSHPTNLTKLIVASMKNAAPQSQVVLLNAGSIRVDDVLQMPVTEYDIIRTLPFGGGIKEVEINGKLLVQILDAGIKNKGTGGFLHYNENLVHDLTTGKWLLNERTIENNKIYRVALSDFLLTGGEANLNFLSTENKEIAPVTETDRIKYNLQKDIRKAIIGYLNSSS